MFTSTVLLTATLYVLHNPGQSVPYKIYTVPRWPKILLNNSKGAAKISFGRGKKVVVRPPILTKRGRKGAGKYFLTIYRFFRGSLDRK